ncbi:hypothetical protein NQ317_016250 [Molorchus minor]|uniref:Tc1-like transposase DDE domain-containing protein n=1 Tax=Molorchus minor TaxID=1323400 RepID=A0ABQ9JXR8_9CUCU|nr:hypothetical protein NQ317_016250 [Molorchus minor]
MIKKVYEGIRARQNISTAKAIDICSSLTKVCVNSVYRAVKYDEKTSAKKKKTETRGRKKIVVDEDVKYAIRRIIHGFFLNELPTLNKIEAAVAQDENLPKLSRKLLLRTMHEMNFYHLKKKPKVSVLKKSKLCYGEEFRNSNTKIYYLDETWVNEGHTVTKVWQDCNIQTRRQAFLEGFSPGLKAPSGRGRRLIITHIGSDSGFLEYGLNVFESRKTGDYHEDMNSAVFETWFSSVLSSIEHGVIVVMDNAPYHSRRTEKLPTSAWKKGQILEWLQ